jgi:uncharacterized membrane protein
VTGWLLAIGRMLGLGSFAGIRPSLTLAVIGVVTYFDWGVTTNSSFAWLSWGWVIGIFVVLAILESTFDKIAKLDRLQDRLIMPYRLVIGGVAGAATIPFGWQGIVVGAGLGAGAAWFAQYTKHLSRPKSVPSEAVVALISAAEDLGAFLGSVLVLAVPYFGYACLAVTGFVYWRVGDRRRAKYKQMRRAAGVRPAAEARGSPMRGTRTPGGAPVAARAAPEEPAAAGDGEAVTAAPTDGATDQALGALGGGESVTSPDLPDTTKLEAGVRLAESERGDDGG